MYVSPCETRQMSSLQRFLEQLVCFTLIVLDLLQALDQRVLVVFHLFNHTLRFLRLHEENRLGKHQEGHEVHVRDVLLKKFLLV